MFGADALSKRADAHDRRRKSERTNRLSKNPGKKAEENIIHFSVAVKSGMPLPANSLWSDDKKSKKMGQKEGEN